MIVERRGGLTLIHLWAVANRELPMLRELLEAGASAAIADEHGDTPLFTLLYSFLDPRRQQPAGCASDVETFEDALELLLAGGASFEAQDGLGRNILEAARQAHELGREGADEALEGLISLLDECHRTWGQTYFADVVNNTKYRDLPRTL